MTYICIQLECQDSYQKKLSLENCDLGQKKKEYMFLLLLPVEKPTKQFVKKRSSREKSKNTFDGEKKL
jgi:hypothetical protein